ncbi:MAG: DNA polymerase III subunit epsilon [Pusillimonas sp.]|nr:DNA polymerase III subunit epsilon [Pusillimonas sp.]
MATSYRPRRRLALLFGALTTGCLAALAGGLIYGYHRANDPDILEAVIIGGVIAGFIISGLITWVWLIIDENIARRAQRLTGLMHASTHSQINRLPNTSPNAYLGDLEIAATELAHAFRETRHSLQQAITRETEQLALEKTRLEKLLGDVPVGVMICSAEHQIVFYNGQIISLLGSLETGTLPGLNHPVSNYLYPSSIEHAYQRLLLTNDSEAASDILCATIEEGRVLAARMRLLDEPGTEANERTTKPGYVLTLRDVTGDLATHSIRAGADRPGDWPLSMIRSSDLASTLQSSLRSKGILLATDSTELILRCDGFQIIAMLSLLVHRLPPFAEQIKLLITPEGAGAKLQIEWQGNPLTQQDLDTLATETVDVGLANTTVQGVLAIHGAYWQANPHATKPQVNVFLREARLALRRPPAIPRAVVYDFGLLSKAGNAEVSTTALDELTYVVFDTETTGLNPEQDDIVQIAAVRIVNGRRIQNEVFDTLVNPGRAIPAGSTKVHGITDAMVAQAPDIATVVQRFHKFAQNSVLVAHNAPFDMGFLRKYETLANCHFPNPILDTVLLSAVLFGESESHSLDALVHRLDITISEEARHTAIGDAIATADALMKMIPALKARNLRTFGDVLKEVRTHRRLLQDLNS